jgi:hypothetical protein
MRFFATLALMRYLYFFLLLIAGCAPTSKEDFQYQGEAICRKLVGELQKVQTREELLKAAPKLKAHFQELVDLMIEARTFEQDHEEEFDVLPQASEISQQLLVELKRVYKIEAGRETIEKAQKEALLKLGAYEARRKKLLTSSQ